MGTQIIEIEKSGEKDSYKGSRLNALRHGILSRHTILPWEDENDYAALLASLEDEYQPSTPTESHLVEELAGIMWRKARVRLAEASTFRKQAAREISNASSGFSVPAYVEAALVSSSDETKPLRNGVKSLAEGITDTEAKEAEEALVYWQERQKCFEEHGRKETLEALSEEDKTDWLEHRKQTTEYRDEMGYEQFPDDKMFSDWLGECVNFFTEKVAKHRHAPAIREQIIGLSYASDRIDGIARYETHLDRKFERVLAMLLKIKEMNRLRDEGSNQNDENG